MVAQATKQVQATGYCPTQLSVSLRSTCRSWQQAPANCGPGQPGVQTCRILDLGQDDGIGNPNSLLLTHVVTELQDQFQNGRTMNSIPSRLTRASAEQEKPRNGPKIVITNTHSPPQQHTRTHTVHEVKWPLVSCGLPGGPSHCMGQACTTHGRPPQHGIPPDPTRPPNCIATLSHLFTALACTCRPYQSRWGMT